MSAHFDTLLAHPAPVANSDPQPVAIGLRPGYTGQIPVHLYPVDRRQHVALIGRSGVGKSTLLKTLFAHDVAHGAGVALIDPHGDLAKECLEYIPRHRIDHVLYFCPSDLEHPISFNLLEDVPPDARPALVSRLIGMFRSNFGTSWGPRVERLLRFALAVLLDQGDATLLHLIRLLDDEVWRAKVVANAFDPLTKHYWLLEYPRLDDRLGGELDQPLLNKLSFLASPALRNVLGQSRSTFHPRHFMDEGRILIADLSKGLLGDADAQILGSLLVAGFEQAAMTRTDTPEHLRRDFHLYIDEFQNFTTDSFPVLLAEARKYRLGLTVANQYLQQLNDQTRSALLGNVGSMIVFRIGVEDAKLLATEMQPLYETELMGQSVGTAWCRLLDHGEALEPFPVRFGLPPPPSHDLPIHGLSRHAKKVIQQSRRHYSKTRAKVEATINAFLKLETGIPPTPCRRVRR